MVRALREGADWEVGFKAFSLNQVHVEEGEPPMWERPEEGSGLLALQYGVACRDIQPEVFQDVHLELFMARHERAKKIKERDVVLEAVQLGGADADALTEEVESGRPLKTIATEHEESVERWGVFGVPTFISDGQAAFVRFMHRNGKGLGPIESVERVLDWVEHWPDLNEFKRPRIPR